MNSIIYAIYLQHNFDQPNVLLIAIDKNKFRNVDWTISYQIIIK